MKNYRSTKRFTGFSACFRQHAADSHCRFLHGYGLEFKITFQTDQLDHRNWCFDFGNCKEIKAFLENLFDHKTVVAKDDPMLDVFTQMSGQMIVQLRVVDSIGCEKFAELVARHVNKMVGVMTLHRVSVLKVKCIENRNNSATYIL